MMSNRAVVVLVAAFSGFATQARAQSSSRQGIEVSGSVAWHRLWDDESSIGTGVYFIVIEVGVLASYRF
jgi:hypothetical protein